MHMDEMRVLLSVFKLQTARVRDLGPRPCSPLLSQGLRLASLYLEIIFPPIPTPPPHSGSRTQSPAANRILRPRQLLEGYASGSEPGKSPAAIQETLGSQRSQFIIISLIIIVVCPVLFLLLL